MAAVDGITANHVDDFVVFIRSRSECTAPRGHIVEEILNSDLGAVSARHRLGIRGLPRLGGLKLASAVISTPGTCRVLSLGGDCQVGYVADACQSLTAKSICGYRREVLKFLQLGCGKTLTQNGQVFFLLNGQTLARLSRSSDWGQSPSDWERHIGDGKARGGVKEHTSIPLPLSVI